MSRGTGDHPFLLTCCFPGSSIHRTQNTACNHGTHSTVQPPYIRTCSTVISTRILTLVLKRPAVLSKGKVLTKKRIKVAIIRRNRLIYLTSIVAKTFVPQNLDKRHLPPILRQNANTAATNIQRMILI